MNKPNWKLSKEKVINAIKGHPVADAMGLFKSFRVTESIKRYDFRDICGFRYESHEVVLSLVNPNSMSDRSVLDAATVMLMESGFNPNEMSHHLHLSESRMVR